LPSLKSKK